ncbi:MAG: DUF4105 domain-containing protein [Flavipsychrobacter sp.]|nr:DUF4105 domain-containing protein [Flavipsychrobacter sp.]
MMKRFASLAIALILSLPAWSQTDSTTSVLPKKSHLRISLLTCGVGELVYEIFGHTAVRVVDSTIEGPLRDIVYNYGMFNGYDDNFELKFMRGKLPYYVATNQFEDFMMEYNELGRQVEEQVLDINDSAKESINAFLQENVLPQNRYYKYDFFFDNCATRIRDVFPATLGAGFKYGKILPDNTKLTFRDIINKYFYRRHWERVGVNILLGSRIDKVMTDNDIMFLPDYLRDGLAGATNNGQKVADAPAIILPGSKPVEADANIPMLLTCSLLLLTLAGIGIKKLHILGRVMSILLLFVSGLLGALIVTMWFATDHQGCANNYNILWAMPVNLVLAFAKPVKKDKYAVLAILMIIASFMMHLLNIQGLVPELMPLMLALMATHINIYRKSKEAANTATA